MRYLRVINKSSGNKQDFETDYVPRIGERIVLQFGAPLLDHFYRVKDVMYMLDNKADTQAAILVEEEANARPWPS